MSPRLLSVPCASCILHVGSCLSGVSLLLVFACLLMVVCLIANSPSGLFDSCESRFLWRVFLPNVSCYACFVRLPGEIPTFPEETQLKKYVTRGSFSNWRARVHVCWSAAALLLT